jgi:hypothetical protein
MLNEGTAQSALLSGPCKSAQDIQHMQQQNLIAAINELSATEQKRLSRLSHVKTRKERSILEKRFVIERQLDANKIERLKSDYIALKSKIETGEFAVRDQSSVARGPAALPEVVQRFHGLDSASEIVSTL